MKNLITILILSFSFSTFAQTGIGTTSPNSNAQLEVASTTKGFLPPRVALTSTTSASPLAAHVAGMVVYNTATAGDVTPGLYVNTGAVWEKQVGGTATTLTGLTSKVAELNKLDGFTGTVTDFNYAKDLRATGVTNTEFDYLDGVTSNIQTQLNGKLTTTGNAATATKLLTDRTINSVSFNGTANITVDPYIEADNTTNANRYLAFSDTGTAAYKRLSTDSNLYYNPSSNRLYATYFQGSLSGNASTASQLYINNDDTGDTNNPILFTASSTAGNKAIFEDSALYFDNTNNRLYSTWFYGSLSGNASSATNASKLYINNDDTGDTNNPILFTATTTAGNKSIFEDSALYFDNTNNRLYSSWFYGSLSGNASTATKLQTARTISLGGDASGSITFDGSANKTLTVAVADDSHSHSTYFPKSGGILSGILYAQGSTALNKSYSYLIYGSTGGPVNNVSQYYSIMATNHIGAPQFNAYSDKRIKTDIKPLTNALSTINKLKPSSYTKIDKVQNGNGTKYGFIAQELEEVIPEAVTKSKGEVPVLRPFDEVNFEEGLEYQLAVQTGETAEMQGYNTTMQRPLGDSVFVVSKQVDDFRAVDYDMVFTHAVAAIQEQQQEIQTLQKRMQEQQVMIDELKKIVSTLVKK